MKILLTEGQLDMLNKGGKVVVEYTYRGSKKWKKIEIDGGKNKMNQNQKDRLEFIKKTHETQEVFKEKTHKRVKELLDKRHKLTKELLVLRDTIAKKRFEERKSLLRGKKNETTLY